jgi:hypothetical protein
MHKYFTLLFFFFAATCLNAQDVFQRASTIHTLDYLPGGGGFGNIIAGVDWDKDGRPDLYTVSANYIDTRPGELIQFGVQLSPVRPKTPGSVLRGVILIRMENLN